MIDLHMHSTASDGTLTPTELVEEAKKSGLKVMALTDHDTLDGIDEAKAKQKNSEITEESLEEFYFDEFEQ